MTKTPQIPALPGMTPLGIKPQTFAGGHAPHCPYRHSADGVCDCGRNTTAASKTPQIPALPGMTPLGIAPSGPTLKIVEVNGHGQWAVEHQGEIKAYGTERAARKALRTLLGPVGKSSADENRLIDAIDGKGWRF